MRRSIAFLLLVLSVPAFAQKNISENDKLASLGKVWGLLKYYHPVVAKAKMDWDRELMDHIAPVLATHNKEDLSRVYLNWIAGLGKANYHTSSAPLPDSYKNYLDTSWISDHELFTDSLAILLNKIQNNSKLKRNHYAHRMLFGFAVLRLKHEDPYEDSLYPSSAMRLLALYRYWNIINYFYPYKNIIDAKWDDVLVEMIPAFRDAKDTTAYNIALRKLTTKIDDSHASLYNKYTSQFFGGKTPPVMYNIIDDKAIVTSFYNDTLAAIDDIRYGDVISEVDGRTIPQILAIYRNYNGASNEATRIFRASHGLIFAGGGDKCTITYERDGITATKTIHKYTTPALHFTYQKDTAAVSKTLDGNIGYVNMGTLTNKHVKSVMREMMHTNAIIFDVRNYPHGTMYKVAKYLKPHATPFAKFTIQARRHPGMFVKFSTYKCGRKNKHYYKGKVIVLFNASTQSHAEFTCMALKTAPKVTCIGSQTAGADGDVISITLPGNNKTWMTGLGVFYPDGTPTQRIGIVPDIKVTPTIPGLRQHRDEVLERAIEVAKTEK